jgi:hypothetical protein
MRVALAFAATVGLAAAAPTRAAADEPTGAPASAPAQTPTAAPGDTPPAPPQPEHPVDEPKADPAYGERPDADTRNFAAPRGKDVIIIAYPDRTTKNLVTIGALAGAGVVAGAIGLYFHIDSRDASDEVSAHNFTGKPWTQERQDAYDRAHSSATAAEVLYGIGGALVLATAVVYIVTEPKAETMTIHPHADYKPSALVAPLRGGGAIVGGAWSF